MRFTPASGNPSSDYKRENPRKGVFPGVLVEQIDLGTQPPNDYGKRLRKIQFTFELVTLKDSNGNNFRVWQDFTASMYKPGPGDKGSISKLRETIESWIGQEEAAGLIGPGGEVDLSSLIGRAALIGVDHRISAAGKTFAVISSITGIPDGMEVPEPTHAMIDFSLDDPENLTEAVVTQLNPFVQKKIRNSEEWKRANSSGTVATVGDIPESLKYLMTVAKDQELSEDERHGLLLAMGYKSIKEVPLSEVPRVVRAFKERSPF